MKPNHSTSVTAIGILCGAAIGALTGCQPFPDGGVYRGASEQYDANVVEIRTDSDFYVPLSAYGRWQVVGSYGRCWFPGQVDSGWSPYSNGYWQQTDGGWYWASNEPWAWATYHYGRWELSPQLGWFWVPQTQWAPAWVEWREGGGYVGWAPLGMQGRTMDRRAYVFVEVRRFTEPVRRSDALENRSAFDRTTVYRDSHQGNRNGGGDGPNAAAIERAGGRRQPVIQVRQLRQQEEMKVHIQHSTPEPNREKSVSPRSGNHPGSAVPATAPHPMTPPSVRVLEPKQPRAFAPEPKNPEPQKEPRPAVQPSRVVRPDEGQRGLQQKTGEKVRPIPGAPHLQPAPTAQHATPVRQDPRKTPPRTEQKAKPAPGHPVAPAKSKADEKKDQTDSGK